MTDVQIAFEKEWDRNHPKRKELPTDFTVTPRFPDLVKPGETFYEGKVPRICYDLDWLSFACHGRNRHFYKDFATGEPIKDTVSERFAKLMLIVTEIAECAEGVRKSLPDSHLPQFASEEVELADALIRIFDYAGWRNLRLGEAFWAKLEYNRTRADHKDEARRAPNGKKI